MAEPELVDDPADARLVDYLGLTDLARRSRVEPAAGLFLAEGTLVVRRALAAGYRLRSALLAPQRLAELADELIGLDAPVYLASAAVLRAATGFAVHRGVLASFQRPAPRSAASVLAGVDRVAVLEGLNNPTNVGAVFRTVAALGWQAVLLDPHCYDPLYRRAVRVSMGATLQVPFARLEPWPAAVGSLRAAGFRVLALTPAGPAVALPAWSPPRRARLALLVGAEGPGLSSAALAQADQLVAIPMAPGVDSLNVAAATAVACYALRA